jgi:hypothetical protein
MAFVVGQLEWQPVTNAPEEVAKYLAARQGQLLSKMDVAELFQEMEASSLCFEGHVFDDTAAAALTECVGKSLNLVAISFRSVKSTANFNAANVCADALVENLSVQRVDLSSCGLTIDDAAAISERVIPWNRTVVDWDFSDNPQLGNTGAEVLLGGLLAATSSIQRLNMRNTGITSVASAAKKLEQLTCLFQVDLNDNGGPPLSVKQAQDLQSVLMNNAALLHPNETRQLRPLVEGAAEEKYDESKSEPASPVRKSPAAVRPRGASVKPNGAAGTTAAARPRGSSFRAPASPPPKQPATAADESPAKKESATPKQSAAASSAPVERHSSGTQRETATHQRDPTRETKSSESAAQPPKTAPHQQPAASATETKPRPTAPAPVRHSTARSASAHSQQTRGRSPARAGSPARVPQRDVAEGADEWKKIRNQYNQFIRASSPASARTADSPSRAIARPKYVLGKRVDDNPAPSAVFKPSFARTRERAPTPAEIRKLAPWAQEKQGAESTVGKVTRVEVAPGHGAAPPTIVTFIDGGRQTFIEDDPRDMAYQARKIQTGQAKPTGSLYKSNTPRDLRFGIDCHDRGFVQRYAQAPGPGYYDVASDWERRARALRERSRVVSGTGRPMFGVSAAPRAATDKPEKDLSRPGPGEYEIP